MNNTYFDDAIEYLKQLHDAKQKEALEMFDGFTKAQDLWARLQSGHGGISETVETLRLQDEYEAYLSDVNREIEKGNTETASIMIGGFADYCKEQVEQNFYIFK